MFGWNHLEKITLGLKATSTNYSKSDETRATILNFKCVCALCFTVSFLLAEQSNLKLKTQAKQLSDYLQLAPEASFSTAGLARDR